ncbi:MAG: hypothetical protein LAT65_08275 [Saccharospirillum sp.]|nr:hypothetical protein [Saccharospirillum sp.]
MSEAQPKETNISRLHIPEYSEDAYPPMPPRIRLAAHCWERTWCVTLSQAPQQAHLLSTFIKRFCSDTVTVRAGLRTRRRLSFAITTQNLDDQSEFELAMMIMAHIERDFGVIERVEDRPATVWPYREFARS